ncbi:hypothetical protein MSAN_00142400 [Mycena sanguinolenta]|uniref:Uncharacterized protein n=1 Tax=Mycena sanguinolenta TaxID=230812 RepID=A0A8H6ZKM0_9AGAR|nr:hypothetical protein MSAN_00142400 [Mycena sanguinolenta]
MSADLHLARVAAFAVRHPPPMRELISSHDEARVAFDVGPLSDSPLPPPSSHDTRSSSGIRDLDSGVYTDTDAPSSSSPLNSHSNPGSEAERTLIRALALTNPAPFALSPPDTGAFFASTDRGQVGVSRLRGGEEKMGDVPYNYDPATIRAKCDIMGETASTEGACGLQVTA